MKRLAIFGIIACVGLMFAPAAVIDAAGPRSGIDVNVVNPDPIEVTPVNPNQCVRSYYHTNTVQGFVGRNEYVTIFELSDDDIDPTQDFVIEFISIWVIMIDGTPIRPVVIESLNPATGIWEDFIHPTLKFVGEQTAHGTTHYNWTVALNSRIKTRSLKMMYWNPGTAEWPPADIELPPQEATFRTVVHGYLIGSECP